MAKKYTLYIKTREADKESNKIRPRCMRCKKNVNVSEYEVRKYDTERGIKYMFAGPCSKCETTVCKIMSADDAAALK